MSPVRVTFRRTVGIARGLYTTILATAGFLAATAAVFAFNLDAAEGFRVQLIPLWTVSAAPFLPVLAAFLGMDVWSDERKTGRIDLLLSSPVRERDFVIGKFLGVWTILAVDVAIALAVSYAFLLFFAPSLLSGLSVVSFLPGVFALWMQGALWCAVTVAASAWFRSPAAAAGTSIAILCALPRGAWLAMKAWSGEGGTRFGDMPLDAHAYDIASGYISSGTLFAYAVLAVTALFAAAKTVASLRCAGRGGKGLFASAWASVALSFLAAALAVSLGYRMDVALDLPIGGGDMRFSDRTRNVLADTRGSMTVTVFLSRKDGRFREVGHFLRALAAEADALGGVGLDIRYVDPVLDTGAAQRLVNMNVPRDSLVFEREGSAANWLLLDGDWGERACVSRIERAASPFRKNCIYWTAGHGEASFEDYESPGGLSKIAGELANDGYVNRCINLADSSATVAEDCALIVIAGAASEFSTVELNRLRGYLEGQEGRSGRGDGGRLLVLMNSIRGGGLPTLLSEWGIRAVPADTSSAGTLSGTDVVASDFPPHPVTAPLAGQQIVLEKPIAFRRSAAADGTGADRKNYSELVRAGNSCLAAVSESGGTGDDLAIRPTRIAAIGDYVFIQDASLSKMGNANRDFFVNLVKYLSGRDSFTSAGTEADRLVSGLDRRTRAVFVIATAVVFPSVFFIAAAALVAVGRRRK
ncbi:MAG: ABC transporter permease [Kiritimatiellae bacterium]|nr:ABC transporter permease [Kiritimatiellia bacterium]